MAGDLPPELSAVLREPDAEAREQAWERFIAKYSRLLLFAARSLGQDYDGAMDRYVYVLERLHEGDFRRLRAYTSDGRTKFTTWLLVVTRRLCLDHYRQRYGRAPAPASREHQRSQLRATRRQLADSIGEGVDPVLVSDQKRISPEAALDEAERRAHLDSAVAALSPQDRLLLKLRFEDDLPAREIATVAGLATPFHVYRRLNTILALLRTTLGHHRLDWSDL